MTMFRVSGLPKSAFMNFSKYTLMLCSSSRSAAFTFSASIASDNALFCSSSLASRPITASLNTPPSITLSRFAIGLSASLRFASSPSK